ncbi:hypothetical protein GSI_09831 [Ganoderma sinense ZZ0214-1]|uniref:Uncharacterized protein n=1 Tax=Ganoderma sinense ZZ0214-1 TaxID=1077348 RepID=A0A2G8S3F0_9APHY|nr:hypothetical protein GSI_09831 [Ganoderma sinense ZZ0214-1]
MPNNDFSRQSRRRLKGYLAANVGGSQVEKLLTLLIESGAIYSGIWGVVVAYQVDHYLEVNLLNTPSLETANFINYFVVIMNGGLIPLIAIYPTVIIVLVTLNRSLVERGISQNLESVPTPHLATIDVSITNPSLRQSQARRTAEILVIGSRESLCGGALELEDERMRTSEEWGAQDRLTSDFP